MELMTYADIERLTGVSANTLRQWLHKGKLPPPDYKPNKSAALWNPKTILAWWEEIKEETDD